MVCGNGSFKDRWEPSEQERAGTSASRRMRSRLSRNIFRDWIMITWHGARFSWWLVQENLEIKLRGDDWFICIPYQDDLCRCVQHRQNSGHYIFYFKRALQPNFERWNKSKNICKVSQQKTVIYSFQINLYTLTNEYSCIHRPHCSRLWRKNRTLVHWENICPLLYIFSKFPAKMLLTSLKWLEQLVKYVKMLLTSLKWLEQIVKFVKISVRLNYHFKTAFNQSFPSSLCRC